MNHEKFVELWNNNVSIAEIAEQLKITKNYVSKYAGAHRDECPKRSKSLENKNFEEPLFEDETVPSSPSSNIEVDTVIIDTSAISQLKTFEIIDDAKYVIISSVVLRELNNLKDRDKGKNSPLHQRIQKLLRACAMDVNNEKYSIINVTYKLGECNDETIARSALKEKNAVVVTSDYGLCCFCKLYNVGYFLINNETVYESYVEKDNVEDTDDNFDNASKMHPFSLTKEEDKLIITCLKGSIEVSHEEKMTTLQPNDTHELFEGDSVIIKFRADAHYIVRRNKKKHELVMAPVN